MPATSSSRKSHAEANVAAGHAKDARLNLRTSARQDELIRHAAQAVDKSVTEFVLDSATIAAEQVLADRRWFLLDERAWSEFQALLERPAVDKPRLREFMAQPDVFDEET